MGLLENSGENITNWLIDDTNNSDDVNGSEQENNDNIENNDNKKSNWKELLKKWLMKWELI